MLIVHLRIAGLIMLALAAVYPVYPRRFGWARQLEAVSLLVRQIFFVHIGFILLLLTMQGVLLAAYPSVVMEPNNAAIALAIGMTVFWVYRLIAQIFIFDRTLWTGQRLHAFVHVVFLMLWIYLTCVCAWVLVDQLRGVFG